jgi:putative acyl-CoA dehydrogenase
MCPTHEVTNQPPPLLGHDVFGTDQALVEGVNRHGANWAVSGLSELGTLAGTEQAAEWGRLANAHPPVLHTHDRYGRRIDEVELHPAWHELMQVAVGQGLHAAPWAASKLGVHVRRAAGFYLWSQVEAGHGCPISMTYAAVPALRTEPPLNAECEPKLTSTRYDPGLRPPMSKAGLLAGMGMTEKQGGSDLRASTTRALAQPGGSYRLTGHKWFCSAPMCDLFLVLAQTPGVDGGAAGGGTAGGGADALTCFLVPRVLPDGTRNAFRLQRLKDKLGNRSNASAEVELDDTLAWRVGPEGRGVATIIEMVQLTRLDCVIGSAAGMRAALAQAVHHTTYRSAFGGPLRDKPLMRNVLADLAVESEAATALMLRLAAAVDSSAHARDGHPQEQAFGRVATAVGKFWVCKRTPTMVAEAMECLGGNGYVEESGLPRLYREAPLNGIWEGAGNVVALDLLRAMVRQPEAVEAFMAEVELASGADVRLDEAIKRLHGQLSLRDDIVPRARRVAGLMALCLQGSLLVRFAPPYVADAFCASRLDGDWGHVLGTLSPGVDGKAIVDRAAPGA